MSIFLGTVIAVGGAAAMYGAIRAAVGARKRATDAGLVFTRAAEDFLPHAADETVVDPSAKPGVVRFINYVIGRFGGFNDGIVGDARHMSQGSSGHKSGIAVDWAHIAYKEHPAVDPQPFIDFLLNNNAEIARRAGITYVIHNGQIWTSGTRQWAPYHGADGHSHHVHVSFGNDGAWGKTSFFDAIT